MPKKWGELTLSESLYHLINPIFLDYPLQKVQGIDCSNCRLVELGKVPASILCCDTIPFFPNFLIGEILSQKDNPTIGQWIDERRGDSIGLWPPPEEAERYRKIRERRGFAPPCPLLKAGRCTVYFQRPALCTTYHCYYPSLIWREFWHCLANYLEILQETAAQYLASTFDFNFQISALICRQNEGGLWRGNSIQPDFYAKLWQNWLGKERQFYKECFLKLKSQGENLQTELKTLRYQNLWSRRKELPFLQRRYLDWEFENWRQLSQPKPKKPPKKYRKGWQKSRTYYPPLTLFQLESYLLWYLQELFS